MKRGRRDGACDETHGNGCKKKRGQPGFIATDIPEALFGFGPDYVQWAIPAFNLRDPNSTAYSLGFSPTSQMQNTFVYSRAVLGSRFGPETLATGTYSIVAAIPLPPGALLLLTGLCGLTFVRRVSTNV